MKETGEYDRTGRKILVGDLVKQRGQVFRVYYDKDTTCYRVKQLVTGHTFHLQPIEGMEVIKENKMKKEITDLTKEELINEIK